MTIEQTLHKKKGYKWGTKDETKGNYKRLII